MPTTVQPHNGTPTPNIEDHPIFAGYMWTRTPTTEGWEHAPIAKLYADAGIHLYAFDIGAGGPAPEWCGPGPGRDSPGCAPEGAGRFQQPPVTPGRRRLLVRRRWLRLRGRRGSGRRLQLAAVGPLAVVLAAPGALLTGIRSRRAARRPCPPSCR